MEWGSNLRASKWAAGVRICEEFRSRHFGRLGFGSVGVRMGWVEVKIRIGWGSNPWVPEGLGFESGGFEWDRVRIQGAQMG